MPCLAHNKVLLKRWPTEIAVALFRPSDWRHSGLQLWRQLERRLARIKAKKNQYQIHKATAKRRYFTDARILCSCKTTTTTTTQNHSQTDTQTNTTKCTLKKTKKHKRVFKDWLLKQTRKCQNEKQTQYDTLSLFFFSFFLFFSLFFSFFLFFSLPLSLFFSFFLLFSLFFSFFLFFSFSLSFSFSSFSFSFSFFLFFLFLFLSLCLFCFLLLLHTAFLFQVIAVECRQQPRSENCSPLTVVTCFASHFSCYFFRSLVHRNLPLRGRVHEDNVETSYWLLNSC